ncbi:hypothetical protein SASPL_124595 [Salvia splendens]|uniref:Solute carrier family 25 (Mitochondrial uncoupling protein), member 8/9 n=1 Tax=Salvia splendens TaxID=180675 RepID=A0A8X8ZPC0_SALSN|nr:hypothetical protein SASPL_124595 [Salvia splendens]
MADSLQISFAGIFACSAFAACFAEICTIPLDTAKVRLQLQKRVPIGDSTAAPKYKGLLGTLTTIAKEEGFFALWNGVVPGLHRQFLYGGLRVGLYQPVKAFISGTNSADIPLFYKVLAALLTGAIAIIVANPTDLVKVRLQAEGKLPVGVARRYSGALQAYYSIVKQEGVGALWTGLGPNIARNAVVNAAELASYDQLKETILKIPGFTDNVLTHILAGLGAGFFAVCIGSPIDVVTFFTSDYKMFLFICYDLLVVKVLDDNNTMASYLPVDGPIGCTLDFAQVKSRMMGDSVYKGTIDCFFKTLKTEGLFAFYKGFLPNFSRLGLWNVIMFLTLEQVKRLFFY